MRQREEKMQKKNMLEPGTWNEKPLHKRSAALAAQARHLQRKLRASLFRASATVGSIFFYTGVSGSCRIFGQHSFLYAILMRLP